MKKNNKWTASLATLALLALAKNALAVEHTVHGLVDARVSYVDGITTHLDGGYGKFRFEPDTNVSLSHGALTYKLETDTPFSAHVVALSYVGGVQDELGISEAYLKYQGLVSQSGHRFSARAGFFYPRISLENNATAWTSPYTLTYSTLNSWIGEEVRNTGLEINWDWLGKFRNSDHDFGLSASVYQNNDTIGTLLSWRGWTQSSRQTLYQERITLPPTKARLGGWLRHQAAETDPFIELDNRIGYEVNGRWHWQQKLQFVFGYYDNNADTTVIENGQYTWDTKFLHFGVKYRFKNNLTLISQFIDGDTLMTSPWGHPVVENDYRNGFVMLSKKVNQHRYSMRIEEFSVTDNDEMPDDDNNEYGKAATLSYQYRFSKNWFIQAEGSIVKSDRASREYSADDTELTETLTQVAAKYYW